MAMARFLPRDEANFHWRWESQPQFGTHPGPDSPLHPLPHDFGTRRQSSHFPRKGRKLRLGNVCGPGNQNEGIMASVVYRAKAIYGSQLSWSTRLPQTRGTGDQLPSSYPRSSGRDHSPNPCRARSLHQYRRELPNSASRPTNELQATKMGVPRHSV